MPGDSANKRSLPHGSKRNPERHIDVTVEKEGGTMKGTSPGRASSIGGLPAESDRCRRLHLLVRAGRRHQLELLAKPALSMHRAVQVPDDSRFSSQGRLAGKAAISVVGERDEEAAIRKFLPPYTESVLSPGRPKRWLAARWKVRLVLDRR